MADEEIIPDEEENIEMRTRGRLDYDDDTPQDREEETSLIDDNRPNPNREIRIRKTKKTCFENHLGVKVNKTAGPSSKLLFDSIMLSSNAKGEVDGIKYKGKKIFVLRGGQRYSLSEDKKMKDAIKTFKTLLEKAKKENEKTATLVVEEQTGVSNIEISENIVDGAADGVRRLIEDKTEKAIEQAKSFDEAEKHDLL